MKGKHESGIILLEVLLAFSILAISLATLLQVASANINRHKTIEHRLIAASHASSLLAQLGVNLPLENHEQSGRVDEFYSWQLEIEEVATIELPRSTAKQLPTLIAVGLSIGWQEGGISKSYIVNTKRIVWR